MLIIGTIVPVVGMLVGSSMMIVEGMIVGKSHFDRVLRSTSVIS